MSWEIRTWESVRRLERYECVCKLHHWKLIADVCILEAKITKWQMVEAHQGMQNVGWGLT